MKEKSIYNMIMSIITAIIIIPILVLGIIFQSIKGNHLTVILMSIYSAFMITYYILKSIYYGKEENKEPLYRLSKVFLDVTTTLIIINFTLLLPTPNKWILFGCLIFFNIIEIILDSMNKALEIKYLIASLKAFIMIYLLFMLYQFNILIMLEIISIIILFFSNILGNVLKNKLILSFDLLSVVLFGIFLILI